jgi:hypothetical protein
MGRWFMCGCSRLRVDICRAPCCSASPFPQRQPAWAGGACMTSPIPPTASMLQRHRQSLRAAQPYKWLATTTPGRLGCTSRAGVLGLPCVDLHGCPTSPMASANPMTSGGCSSSLSARCRLQVLCGQCQVGQAASITRRSRVISHQSWHISLVFACINCCWTMWAAYRTQASSRPVPWSCCVVSSPALVPHLRRLLWGGRQPQQRLLQVQTTAPHGRTGHAGKGDLLWRLQQQRCAM